MSVAAYRRFPGVAERAQLERAAEVIDVARYRESCIGFTLGFVSWHDATTSLQRVWTGIPDLHVELHDVFGDGDTVLARGVASGTNTALSTGSRRRGRRIGSPSSTSASSTTAASCAACSTPT